MVSAATGAPAVDVCTTCIVHHSGAKYLTTLTIAPAHIPVLKDVFAWFIVPLIAVGHL
jgi:hypothetical protein